MDREQKMVFPAERKAGDRPAALKLASLVLGLATLALVVGVLSGASLPFVTDDRSALLALTIVGMAMCASGPLGQIAAAGRWLSPAGLFGVLMGLVGLGLVGTIVAGRDLPLIATDRQAFVALSAIVAIKGSAGIMWRLRA